MVYRQQSNIKTLTFIEAPQTLHLTSNSQPFIGDINGDQIDDIIFNNAEAVSNGKINVAIYNQTKQAYTISNFKDTMVDPECGGFTSPIEAPMLTTPHSVSMVDFDGDCLSDLFLTV